MSKKPPAPPSEPRAYRHDDATSPGRPEVGTQAEFKKRKAPRRYRYDSSLSPALEWDQGSAREAGEALLRRIEEATTLEDAKAAAAELRAMSRPFLDWAGKAERGAFDVPTLPLFVHERLSTKAILETLTGHQQKPRQSTMFDLFAETDRPLFDRLVRPYEHQEPWVNRLILGDSLVVMSSLLEYEGLGGKVQMIYMDPPYGVKFGSNFQPFVRKRDVAHGDDADLTREPEMVQAYRDTWELGLHSYLTYLRDRLRVARELLTESGSCFVQISDENVHHVRELMDEVFGAENFMSVISFRKKTMPLGAKHLEAVGDFLVWYAKDIARATYSRLYVEQNFEGDPHWNFAELADGTRRQMTKAEINNHALLPEGAVPLQLIHLYPVGVNRNGIFTFPFRGAPYDPPAGNSWFTNPTGMQRLADANRIEPYEDGRTLRYVLKATDCPVSQLTNLWSDTSAPRDKVYAVQTDAKVVQRCMLMTTRPGDLVLDPTCGGGTTALAAERWGRRWIAIDVSRVPLAVVRQRLLTATFPWFRLVDEARGPRGGFVYREKYDSKSRPSGGVVRIVSRGTFSGDEQPREVVLVDRPEENDKVTRICGPFVVEATMPTPAEWETQTPPIDEAPTDLRARMLEVLKRSPVLRLDGNRTVTFQTVRAPAKSLVLSAEALAPAADGTPQPVAFVFGPENGPVTEKLVYEAAKEAHAKSYGHLYVIGFAIQPNARAYVDQCEAASSIAATYVQATPDLLMGDLLKSLRSSQVFSVCGLPDVTVGKLGDGRFQVTVKGLDVFDPVTMEVSSRDGSDVPAWFLDTDYNGLCFHVCQAFFPRTSAWESLAKALKTTYEPSVWEHLRGTTSAPFGAGEHKAIAVKVIDDRGNELLVTRSLP